MTDKEAMKLALDALETDNSDIQLRAAIVLRTALKERLAQETALQALHNENERLGLYKDAYAEQEPVAWADHGVVNWIADKQFKHASLLYTTPPQRTEQEPVQEPVAEIVCDALGCLTTRWNDGWIPNEGDKLYSIPPQRTDQNFCPRCGKRTPDLITIHTCTPPREGT